MDYNMNNLIPFIPPSEYDRVAEQFLEEYCPEALKRPMAVPAFLRKPIFTELLFSPMERWKYMIPKMVCMTPKYSSEKPF